MTRQPFLHDLVVAVSAPTTAVAGRDGQIRQECGRQDGGAQGVYDGDTRVLSRAVLTVDGVQPEPLVHDRLDTDGHRFLGVVRGLGDDGPDPTVLVERTRRLDAAGMTELIELVSRARAPVRARVTLGLGCDLAPMNEVKSGAPTRDLPAGLVGDRLSWTGPGGRVVLVAATGAPEVRPGVEARLRWDVTVPARSRWSVTVSVSTTGGVEAVVVRPRERWSSPVRVTAGDRRFDRLLARSVQDLRGLCLADPLDLADQFIGAGAPWYLTLFGRDSIWAARMLLPLGTELAAGTLRTLARRQGSVDDPSAEEQPGKILHEIRSVPPGRAVAHAGHAANGAMALPPVYFGTVDATALWVSLLHDAWRWGMPAAQVEALLPALQAALGWLADHALDGRGFVSYRDHTGHGLANQGWKDSHDSVQFRDGSLATAPVALCEAQGYAVAAARHGADLLDHFDLGGAQGWRDWAQGLTDRFRSSFWIDSPVDGGVPHPAMALDGHGRPVDALTSNIGHLLGTGVLDDAETAAVVSRLGSRALDSGHGLRTMATDAAGYNALSYHCGSVWTHDSAVVVAGLARVATPAAHRVASSLTRGLLDAAEGFDHQLPELFGGQAASPGTAPVPYPASCHPQAWAAAAAVALLQAAVGIEPDVPGGRVAIRPLDPAPFGALDVTGLRVAGQPLELSVAADGRVDVLSAPPGLRVVTGADPLATVAGRG